MKTSIISKAKKPGNFFICNIFQYIQPLAMFIISQFFD